jgi:hypothetical protein
VRRRRAGLVLFLLSLAAGIGAAEPYLTLSLGADYSALGFQTMFVLSEDGIGPPLGSHLEIREEAIRRLLEEARWIFSGMVYGFRFRYVPGNLDEGFSELFELEPQDRIPPGDPRLEVYQVEDELQNIQVIFNYWPDEFQSRLLRVSRGGDFRGSAGMGGVPMMQAGSRIASFEAGVKQALREDLRSIEYNRPLEVRGLVYLASSPLLSIRAGEYTSRVKVLYRREDLKSYPLNY